MLIDYSFATLVGALMTLFNFMEYIEAFQQNTMMMRNFQTTRLLKKWKFPLLQQAAGSQAYHQEESTKLYNFHPTVTDRARTITHICGGGTLCTTSVISDVRDYPYGSYVDYILDEKGWPVLLLNNNSLHTQNIRQHSAVSLFCHLPQHVHGNIGESNTAALSRVNILGRIEKIPANELNPLKFAFILVHPYAEQIAESPKFAFYRVQPQRIYFSGGFGVMSTWINVHDYEQSQPDVLAQEVPNVLSKTNDERQGELLLICKHFLHVDNADLARIQAIDRLGIDVRVKKGTKMTKYN
jgi:putative heme iron utilization protein